MVSSVLQGAFPALHSYTPLPRAISLPSPGTKSTFFCRAPVHALQLMSSCARRFPATSSLCQPMLRLITRRPHVRAGFLLLTLGCVPRVRGGPVSPRKTSVRATLLSAAATRFDLWQRSRHHSIPPDASRGHRTIPPLPSPHHVIVPSLQCFIAVLVRTLSGLEVYIVWDSDAMQGMRPAVVPLVCVGRGVLLWRFGGSMVRWEGADFT